MTTKQKIVEIISGLGVPPELAELKADEILKVTNEIKNVVVADMNGSKITVQVSARDCVKIGNELYVRTTLKDPELNPKCCKAQSE